MTSPLGDLPWRFDKEGSIVVNLLVLKYKKNIFHNLKIEYWQNQTTFCLRQKSKTITPLVKTRENSLFFVWLFF